MSTCLLQLRCSSMGNLSMDTIQALSAVEYMHGYPTVRVTCIYRDTTNIQRVVNHVN